MTKQTCHYLFTATFSLLGQAKGSYASSKKFENKNLILAREAAFEYYDNFMHGMLLAQGLTQREADEATDRMIRKVIDKHIDPKTFSEVSLLTIGRKVKLPDHISNKISISLITENAEYVVHLITKDVSDMPHPSNLNDLESEYAYYKENKHEIGNHETTIMYFDVDEYYDGFEDTALGEHTILRTPFDWTGYDENGWWL